MFKNSDLISKKTHIPITRINWLMLFKEVIDVYSENNSKPINTHSEKNAELVNVKVCGTNRYRCALKG
jgi:hypothetical protein